MSKNITIDLGELETVLAYLKRLESVDLRDITWMRLGQTVAVSEKEIYEWEFTGLNNRHFAEMNLV